MHCSPAGSVDRKVAQYLNRNVASASVKARSQSPHVTLRDNPFDGGPQEGTDETDVLDEVAAAGGSRRGRSASRASSTTSSVRKFRDGSWDKKWEDQVN